MFNCPRCHTEVPRSKALLLNKSSKIECQNCHALLKPNEDTMKKIGAIGGSVGQYLRLLLSMQWDGWVHCLFWCAE